MRVGSQRHAPATLPREDSVPIVWEAGWAGAENLSPHRDSIPGPPSPKRVSITNTLPRPAGSCCTVPNSVVQNKTFLFQIYVVKEVFSLDNGKPEFPKLFSE
jgi:hypothetical protein